ncbi:ABC transporter substrate-binding protein [Nocardioides dokdonensis]|nr:extracellular solute-binding protein [Nocardioides dokdonensis]
MRRRARRGVATTVALLTLALVVTACDSDAGRETLPGPDPVPAPQAKVELTLGVWGKDAEVAGYEKVVEAFNETSGESTVTVESWSDRDALDDALRAGEASPDVFLASRRDLTFLRSEGYSTPVDELLDERSVEFGDGYSRDALEAFSADTRLQCMPFGVSPMVIYRNTALVDLERMGERGLDVPSPDSSRFTFDEFRAAAEFATKPRKRSKGVYIEPSLRGLAPFVYSGGGEVFDDESAPTSLNLSSDESRDALERTLELLRRSNLTLSEEQLAKATPLEWFERGRLGMMAGYRDLVPELRAVAGLDFDVLPMPTLDSPATIGDLTGLCLNPATESITESADLLVHMISDEVVGELTRTGYLVPANQQVALAEDFTQPALQPRRADLFTSSVRSMRVPPLLDAWTQLQALVDDPIAKLVTTPGVLDLETATELIDLLSRTVLSPEELEESDSPDSPDSTGAPEQQG